MAKIIDPRSLPLAVGQKITVSTDGRKYNVSLRGWYTCLHIIVDLPVINGGPLRLASGTGCDTYLVKDGKYFIFKGTVLYASPGISLMTIQFSENIKVHELRKNSRLKVSHPARFSHIVSDKSVTHPCIVRDLSLTGALITHKKALPKGSNLALSIELETGSLSHQDAVIQNVRHNPKSETETYVSGLMFSSLSGENREVLGKHLETQQAANNK